MRRPLSLLLVLFFGLWPLSGMLQASDDARLPACCRRHGTHHCAMAMQMAGLLAPSATPAFTAPPTCPLFPGFKSGISTPAHALAASAAQIGILLVTVRAPRFQTAAAVTIPIGTPPGRGPPAPPLS